MEKEVDDRCIDDRFLVISYDKENLILEVWDEDMEEMKEKIHFSKSDASWLFHFLGEFIYGNDPRKGEKFSFKSIGNTLTVYGDRPPSRYVIEIERDPGFREKKGTSLEIEFDKRNLIRLSDMINALRY